MSLPTILLEVRDGIATLTLSRPEKLNAFTEPMAREFLDALTEVEKDKDVRAMVITGCWAKLYLSFSLRPAPGFRRSYYVYPLRPLWHYP